MADSEPIKLVGVIEGQSEGAVIPNNKTHAAVVESKTKKKSKGRKSAARRGPTALAKNRGNGFEEYFADPPMTPAEASEEKSEIYSSNLSFAERMQNCIQRYRSRRRLYVPLIHYFSEYLFLGGVDTCPSTFRSLSQAELKELTPAQRREATATDVIYGTTAAGQRFYNGDPNTWSVDFKGVAAGFFSTTLAQITASEPDNMMLGIGMVENFLRYVLHHDVCPEYENDVKEAMAVCNDAREEWPMLWGLYASLPGQFNLAAAELFNQDTHESWSFTSFKRPENFDPKAVFFTTLAFLDDIDLFESLSKGTPKVSKEYSCTLELIDTFRPDQAITKQLKSVIVEGNSPGFVPIGSAIFKPAIIEDDWEQPAALAPDIGQEVMLYFDDGMLENMKPGMKMTLTLCELDVGFKFVKTIEIIVPSFYTYLPQEMMRHFKEPKDNDRPAPSVENPEAEEGQFATVAKDN